MIEDFLREAASLKAVDRQGWKDRLGMGAPESVADHSYMTAVICAVTAEQAGLDPLRTIRMALLHDLAEARTGDLVPGQVPEADKRRLEDEAMSQILAKLDGPARESCRAAWDELCRAETPEARFVHEADKLEMALQADVYKRQDPSRDVSAFLQTAKLAVSSPALQDILGKLCRP